MELEWWQWLLASVHDLKALGLNPQDRVRHCGHRFAISQKWARTVGLWGGVASARTIMDAAGSERPAYENFKHRNHLSTCGHSDPEPGYMASLSAYLVVEEKRVGRASLGEAAAAAAKNWKVDPASGAGMLPVELMLRWTDMALVLEASGLDPIRFHSLRPAPAELAYVTSTQLAIEVPDEAFDLE